MRYKDDLFDQLRHIAEEERQQQRADVTAIHVCIGHNDDAAIAKTFQVKVFPNASAQSRDQRTHFVVTQYFVKTGPLSIDDLTA